MPYIDVSHLCKTFSVRKKRGKGLFIREKTSVRAIDDISFTINAGELVGYIGPNGAGKSTTVKVLSGILTPDSGRVYIGGHIPWIDRKQHTGHIGVVFGQRTQLWWDVPVKESYSLLRDIYLVPVKIYRQRLDELVSALSLELLMDVPLRQLSLGQRMRAELAGSLLHGPELLFLDEPSIGLDAVCKLALREFLIQENRRRGTTVLLTTHDMEDIAALCPRVIVLGHGKLLFDGTLSKLLQRYDTARIVHVRYAEATRPSLPDGCFVSRDGDTWMVTYDPSLIPTGNVLALLQGAGTILEYTVREQSLDRMIADMYREMAL